MNIKAVLVSICKIHEATKGLTILSEEFDSEFLSFLQPRNELMNAYQHIIRAVSNKIGLREEKNNDVEDYTITNLGKALSHEYRAFFDTADYLSISLRKKITEELRPFSSDTIKTVLVDYYSTYRPRIDRITKEIANLRESKDIGKTDELLPSVERYNAELHKLLDIHSCIINAVPTLMELEKKQASKDKKGFYIKFGLVIITALATGFVSWLVAVFTH